MIKIYRFFSITSNIHSKVSLHIKKTGWYSGKKQSIKKMIGVIKTS